MSLGLHVEAAATLEEHALLRPADALTRYNLAVCYFHMGQPDWAMSEMLRSVALDPERPDGYRWLVSHHVERNELGHAAWWYGELLRNWTATEAEKGPLRAATASLAAQAAARTQAVAPPSEHPVRQGPPEGLLEAR